MPQRMRGWAALAWALGLSPRLRLGDPASGARGSGRRRDLFAACARSRCPRPSLPPFRAPLRRMRAEPVGKWRAPRRYAIAGETSHGRTAAAERAIGDSQSGLWDGTSNMDSIGIAVVSAILPNSANIFRIPSPPLFRIRGD